MQLHNDEFPIPNFSSKQSRITEIPPEIFVKIYELLRIPDIHTLALTCRTFCAMYLTNRRAIYRNAAVRHGYVSRSAVRITNARLDKETLQEYTDGERDNQVLLEAMMDTTWLEFCKEHCRIDRAWAEPSFPKQQVFRCVGEPSFHGIHREGNKLLLTAINRPGFAVVDALDHDINSQQRVEWINTAPTPPFIHAPRPDGPLVLASDGFLLFKVRAKLYRVWSQAQTRAFEFESQTDLEDETPTYGSYRSGMKLVGDVKLDGNCNGMQMKDDCLMMSTNRNTLYIFDLPRPAAAAVSPFDDPEPDSPSDSSDGDDLAKTLTPTSTLELLLLSTEGLGPRVTPDDTVGHTTCLDFSSKHIFHSTTERFRIICRTTYTVVFSVHEAAWHKVACGKWSKCITSNAFCVPPPVLWRRVDDPRVTSRTEDPMVDEVVRVRKGAGEKRKDSPWRWDVMQMVVREEEESETSVVMSFGGGWIVGLCGVEGLVSGRRSVEDAEACWALDIGAPCSDLLFDGRRLVWNHNQRIVILNLCSGENDTMVWDGMPVVRICQRDLTAEDTSHSMALTNTAVWFLGGERGASDWARTVHLIRWAFGE